jgi:DNA-binding transcriptional ArsR family regulator
MAGPQIEEIGRLLGDRSRATMLMTLMDGRAWTGRELAATAFVTPSTASEHLQRLVDSGLLSVVKQGKHRYYRIASPTVAQLLEAMMVVAPQTESRPSAPTRPDADLRRARMCYDHLAGELGVAIAHGLIRSGAIRLSGSGDEVADVNVDFFEQLGIVSKENGNRRPLCRLCLDWTERRFHIGGRLGAALAHRALDLKWIRRRDTTRALIVSSSGAAALHDAFGIAWD